MREVHAGQISVWIMPILIGLNIVACSSVTKPASNGSAGILPVICREEQQEIERLQKLLVEREAQQNEIERLQKLLAEKEAQIRTQQARQQDQAKTLQETSSLAAHAQVKLRRLATRPAAASARSSPSTARRCPTSCSSRSCSATSAARSPAPSTRGPASSRRRPAAPSSDRKSVV